MKYEQRLNNILRLGQAARGEQRPLHYHDGVLVYDERMVPVGELPSSLLNGLAQEERIRLVIDRGDLKKLNPAERELLGADGTVWPLDFAGDEDEESPGF